MHDLLLTSCPWLHVHLIDTLLEHDLSIRTPQRDGYVAYLVAAIDRVLAVPIQMHQATALGQNRDG